MVKLSAQYFIANSQVQKDVGLKVLTDQELHALQKTLMDIYVIVEEVCQKHSLTLLLGGGSALGAIRHKGFIPWDDDIDLMMFREDYDQFIKIISEEPIDGIKLSNSGFSLHVIKTGTEYRGLFDSASDESGVYIDIFPIDYVSENHVKRLLCGWCSDMLIFLLNSKRIYRYNNKLIYKIFKQNSASYILYLIRIVIGCMVSGISDQLLRKIHTKLVVDKKMSSLITIPTGRKHYFGEMLKYQDFIPAKSVVFEGITCYVPNHVDVYLSNLYGTNYMDLPPEDKREVHPCIAFSIDNL